jgi:hypothetical protein
VVGIFLTESWLLSLATVTGALCFPEHGLLSPPVIPLSALPWMARQPPPDPPCNFSVPTSLCPVVTPGAHTGDPQSGDNAASTKKQCLLSLHRVNKALLFFFLRKEKS